MAPEPDVTSRFGGVYRRSLANEPASLDPAKTADIYAYTVINQIFDNLVQFDAHLNVLPAMAGFWEASRDGLTWTFSLRSGARFHNGREVTADDWVYSLTRLLDPVVASPVADLFSQLRGARAFREGKATRVAGLQALGRYTLRISLEAPYTPFLSILAMANAKVVPREEVERLGDRFGRQPVGSGPFTFVSWEPGRRLVLQAFDYYHEGRPFLDRIVFKMHPGGSFASDLEAFLRGELEETVVPSTESKTIRHAPRFRRFIYRRRPALHLLYVGFNTRRPPFTDRRVRQAFNFAVNREAIVREIRQGGSVLARGVLPPGMPGYNPHLDGYYYNPRRARALLAEAGFPNGKGLPELQLWHSSKEATTPRELQAYQTDLAQIGVRVQVHRAPDWPAFKAVLSAGQADMFRLGWHSDIPDPDHFFYPLLASDSPTNRTFFQNAEIDALLQRARQETDEAHRLRLYQEIEQRVLAEAPWISQHHRVFESLYQPYVQGISVNALGRHYTPLKRVWFKAPERTPK